MPTNHELQRIISGISSVTEGDLIQTVAHYLKQSQKTSGITQESEQFKEQETTWLLNWATQNNAWFLQHDETRFIARGAEQRVYLDNNPLFVYKLNDAIFYRFWIDYFHSLLIHNYFFPQTAYRLVGFLKEDEMLYAVVQQPYIEMTEPTNLTDVSFFLKQNGFVNTKNNDYLNHDSGIILEDLHDENVLTRHGIIFFIDTVFYLMPSFYMNA